MQSETARREVRERLESIFNCPNEERTVDHHEYLYQRVVDLEREPTSPAEQVRLLLFKSRILADMEGGVYSKIVGQPRTGHQTVEAALEVANQALVIAAPLPDDALRGQVQLFRGQLLRRVDRLLESAAAYRAATALLEPAVAENGAVDPSLTRDLFEATIKLVSAELILAHFVAAEESLERAEQLDHQLRSMGQGSSVDREIIPWMQSLLARVQGKMFAALSAATEAADSYLRKDESISKVRALWLATEVAIDLAETRDIEDSARQVYLEAAARYLGLTEHHAKVVMDPAGAEMAKLSEARMRQLKRPTTPVAVTRVRKVLEFVDRERPWDFSLLIDTHTTLGRLLAARGEAARARGETDEAQAEIAEARAAFVTAVELAKKNGTPGMAWYAEKALKEL